MNFGTIGQNLGGVIGGAGGGIGGAAVGGWAGGAHGAGTGALVGAGAGLVFPPAEVFTPEVGAAAGAVIEGGPAAVAGGLAGATTGAATGWVVGGRIGRWLDHIVTQMEGADGKAEEHPAEPTDECAGQCGQVSHDKPPLPANPDDLLKQGWEETTDPRTAARSNRRTFKNSQTGQELEFDKGRPGETGFKSQDHYHLPNSNSTGKRDYYLDGQGNGVPDGSKSSHLLPNE